MKLESHLPLQQSKADLATFSRWVILPLLLSGLKEILLWAHGGSWRSLFFGTALLLQVLNHLLGLWLLRQGRFDTALRMACWGILAVFCIASIHAQGDPVAAVIPVMGVALALPHLVETDFQIYCVVAWLALMLNMAMLALYPMPASGSESEQALGRLLSTSAGVGATLLLLWHIKNNLGMGQSRLREAEQEEELEEERYRMIVDNAREGICVLDKGGAILTQNAQMQELMALDEGMVREMLFRRCMAGESLSHEFQVLGSGGARWILLNAHPLKNSQGEVSGALALATEITEIKRMQASLALAQGSEAEGRLAGGIAHDMNNVLAVINGACELLATQIAASDAPQRLALERIRQPAAEATAVVRQLLAFRRPPDQAREAAEGSGAGKERILLVDDDEAVRSVTARMLKLSGYEVIEAASAAEAWTIYELGGADILVTDILMPGTPGTVLANRLREKCPELPVLLISGFGGAEMPGTESPLPRSIFLAKPYSASILAEKVRECLDLAKLWKHS